MKARTCYIFLPSAYVGLENAVPFLVSLKEQGWLIVSVIMSPYVDELMRIGSPLNAIVSENSRVLRVGYDPKSAKLAKVLALMRFLVILMRIAVSAGSIVITCEPTRGIFFKVLERFSRFKAGFYFLSKSNAPVQAERFGAEARATENKNLKNYLHKTKKALSNRYIGKHLIHSAWEIPTAELLGFPRERVVIGYPKMMRAWRKFAAEYPVRYEPTALHDAESVATILVLEPAMPAFDPGDGAETLLREVIAAIRNHFSDILIVLKPKPKRVHHKNGKDAWLENLLKELNDDKIVVTYAPNPFLARKSKMAVAISETTAGFDYLIAGVPYLEHSRYDRKWGEVYPPETFWTEFGVPRTKTPGDLNEMVDHIKSGNYAAPGFAHWANYFKHQENPAALSAL